MARGVKQGKCHLCGVIGDLTYEHVPPRKAFNDRRTVRLSFAEAMALGPDAPVRGQGRVVQGGVGAHTLCGRCNNDSGRWYAPALIDWCYRGYDILEKSGGEPRLISIYQCYPLRILKEILVMFCSVNGDRFADAQPWLRRFLLNQASRDFHDDFRLFVYYNAMGKLRYVGTSGMVDLSTGNVTIMSEISYPPFGYVLTMGSDPPDARLTEITFFARYLYNEIARLEVKLPLLASHTMYPGDYRTRSEIRSDAEHGG